MADFPFQLPPAGGSSAGSPGARSQRLWRQNALRANQQSIFGQALQELIQRGQSSGSPQSVLNARRTAALERLTGAGRGVQGPSPFRWATGSSPAGYLPPRTTGSALVPTTGSQLSSSGVSSFGGSGRGLGRLAGPLVSAGLVGLDVYDATQTGRDPLRAGIRGGATFLGGLGAGALGGAAGLPTTGPGAIPAALASYAAGSLGTGAIFDHIWPENTTMNDTTRYASQRGFIGPVPQPPPGFIGPMPGQPPTGAWTVNGFNPNAVRPQRPIQRSTFLEGAPLYQQSSYQRPPSDPTPTYKQYETTPEGQYERYFKTPEFGYVFGSGARGEGAPKDAAAMEALGSQLKADPESRNIASMYAAQSAMGRINQDAIQKMYEGDKNMQAWAKANPMLAQREYLKSQERQAAAMPLAPDQENVQGDLGTGAQGEGGWNYEQLRARGAGREQSPSPLVQQEMQQEATADQAAKATTAGMSAADKVDPFLELLKNNLAVGFSTKQSPSPLAPDQETVMGDLGSRAQGDNYVVERVPQPAAKDEKSARAKLLQRAFADRFLNGNSFPAGAPKPLF